MSPVLGHYPEKGSTQEDLQGCDDGQYVGEKCHAMGLRAPLFPFFVTLCYLSCFSPLIMIAVSLRPRKSLFLWSRSGNYFVRAMAYEAGEPSFNLGHLSFHALHTLIPYERIILAPQGLQGQMHHVGEQFEGGREKECEREREIISLCRHGLPLFRILMESRFPHPALCMYVLHHNHSAEPYEGAWTSLLLKAS